MRHKSHNTELFLFTVTISYKINMNQVRPWMLANLKISSFYAPWGIITLTFTLLDPPSFSYFWFLFIYFLSILKGFVYIFSNFMLRFHPWVYIFVYLNIFFFSLFFNSIAKFCWMTILTITLFNDPDFFTPYFFLKQSYSWH